MSEIITVEVNLKPYVAKYLENNYGKPIDLSKSKTIRNIFRKYLIKPDYRRDVDITKRVKYENRQIVYIVISEDDFYRYGWELSVTDQMNFNSDMEFIIKQRLHDHLLVLQPQIKIITKRIDCIRSYFRFTEDDLSYEAIKKDFYRFRISNNLDKMSPKSIQL